MLQILKSFFGLEAKKEKYPEAMIRKTIERVAEKTDPWLKAVTDYRYKLRPAVIRSLDHVSGLVGSLAPPQPVEFGPDGSCPALASFFTSQTEILNTFRFNQTLLNFIRENKPASKRITTLLMMEKIEKTIFGAELSGDVIVRDVPQVTVVFLNQRFLEPSYSENETRRKLEGRAFDQLLKLAHRRITVAKSARKDLVGRQTLFQSKLALLQGNDGDYQHESNTMQDIAQTKEQLELVEDKLREQGSEEKMQRSYLDIVTDILSHPEEHLWESSQHLILDQSGIKRNQPSENDSEFTLQELRNSDGQQWVMLLVDLPVDALQKICS